MASFSDSIKDRAYFRQSKKCGGCGTNLNEDACEAHHLIRRADGGPNTLENCVWLCKPCHFAAHDGGNYRKSMKWKPSEFKFYDGLAKKK